MVASTTARVTLVTAAAATATALPLVMMRSTKICVNDYNQARTLRSTIGLERFLSLSGLPAHIRNDIQGTIDKLLIIFFQEVKWYVSANHAGGYSYRLCKVWSYNSQKF